MALSKPYPKGGDKVRVEKLCDTDPAPEGSIFETVGWTGKVYSWGLGGLGQYGPTVEVKFENGDKYIYLPDELELAE